jgi:hypothetical protein
VALLYAFGLAVSGCAEWQGSETVSTETGGDGEGHGPGLFTGKEGAIVLYQDVWSGAVPGGGVKE